MNTDWDKYSEILDGQKGVEIKEGRTLDEWERDIKVILQETVRTIGMKRSRLKRQY